MPKKNIPSSFLLNKNFSNLKRNNCKAHQHPTKAKHQEHQQQQQQQPKNQFLLLAFLHSLSQEMQLMLRSHNIEETKPNWTKRRASHSDDWDANMLYNYVFGEEAEKHYVPYSSGGITGYLAIYIPRHILLQKVISNAA